MNSRTLGYLNVVLAVTIFAAQDGFSKFLGDRYPPIMITMIRFWAFAAFVALLAACSPGGFRAAIVTRRPMLQVMRGVILASEIVVVVAAFKTAGLAMTQAILQSTPLIVTILSIPLLREKVGWRRGIAVLVGLGGVLVILNPCSIHFDSTLLLPIAASFMYALYSVSTRAVGQHDSARTSLFYAGVAGAAAITFVGPFYWTPMAVRDWPAMAALCICGTVSHFFLVQAYRLLSAVEVQPLTYLQLVFSVGIATIFFGEKITVNMVVGGSIVVAAGLFTVWREQRRLNR